MIVRFAKAGRKPYSTMSNRIVNALGKLTDAVRSLNIRRRVRQYRFVNLYVEMDIYIYIHIYLFEKI